MALPADGVTLDDKQQTVAAAARSGRRHPRAEHRAQAPVGDQGRAAGGGLRAGATLTLAVSDVVGDDLSRDRAPGPTVPTRARLPTPSRSWSAAAATPRIPRAVVERLRARRSRRSAGDAQAGGDARLARATARVIGSRSAARGGARAGRARPRLRVHVVDEPVTGEARDAAVAHVRGRGRRWPPLARRCCVIAAGETTVTVTGGARAAATRSSRSAMARALAALGRRRRRGQRRHRRHRRPDRRGRRHRRLHHAARAAAAGLDRRALSRRQRHVTRFSIASAISSAPARPAPTSAIIQVMLDRDKVLARSTHRRHPRRSSRSAVASSRDPRASWPRILRVPREERAASSGS